jgi:hypothetical protein
MNLSESIRHVLQNESSNVFKNLFKEDVKTVLVSVKDDFQGFYKSGNSLFHSVKNDGLKSTLGDAKETVKESLHLLRVFPMRMKRGFQFFKEDFAAELDSLEDNKEKTMFSLKVIGALTSYTLTGLYGVKKARNDLKVPGFPAKKTFTKFLMAELIFKITQLFILRFLEEVEKNNLDQDDLKKIYYFKHLMLNPDAPVEGDEPDLNQDEAIEIVDKLKYYILSGER